MITGGAENSEIDIGDDKADDGPERGDGFGAGEPVITEEFREAIRHKSADEWGEDPEGGDLLVFVPGGGTADGEADPDDGAGDGERGCDWVPGEDTDGNEDRGDEEADGGGGGSEGDTDDEFSSDGFADVCALENCAGESEDADEKTGAHDGDCVGADGGSEGGGSARAGANCPRHKEASDAGGEEYFDHLCSRAGCCRVLVVYRGVEERHKHYCLFVSHGLGGGGWKV